MKFLVVDDSAIDRHLMISLLEKRGHEVEAYNNPTGVLEKIATGKYAAVILDIVMPEKDGFKFLREVRSNPETAKQHIILCSSKSTPIEINYGLKRSGANDYITKPVTEQTLDQALKRI